MKKFWEQLRPQERRWMAGIGFVVFVILNYLLVWPQFKEWNRNAERMKKASEKIATFQKELRHKDEYTRKIKFLEAEGGQDVPPEDQQLQLEYFYRARATENGVSIINNSRPNTRTPNDFFIDQEIALNTSSGESNLVGFLYSLGSSNSMVRVKAMSLRPDPPRHQLGANITIVASYQKKSSTGTGRTAATAPTTAATPSPAPPPVQPVKGPNTVKPGNSNSQIP